VILHSLDPWLLARHQPSLARTAIKSLWRVGFEVWFPTHRQLRPLPLRMVPAHKRHLAAYYLRGIRCPRFPGYLLIRPLPFCEWDVNRLADLRGCGSIVSVDGRTAKIQDFEVELMRIAEATGVFDQYVGVGRRRYTITPENGQEWIWHSEKAQNLDGSGKFRLFVDSLGRIARMIEGDETSLSENGRHLTPSP
jgi:hypothetical protein